MAAFAKTLLHHWHNVGIAASVAFNAYNPMYFCSGDGYLGYDRYKETFVQGMFLCSGVGLPTAAACKTALLAKGYTRHFLFQGMSLVGMPLVTAATAPYVVDYMDLPNGVNTGICFLSCLPTTVGVSATMTAAAAGDGLLATFHSALGNTVGPFLVPFTAKIFAHVPAEVDIKNVFKKLIDVIIIPMGLGIALKSLPGLSSVFGVPKGVKFMKEVQQVCLLMVLSNVFANAFKMAESAHEGSTKNKNRTALTHKDMVDLLLVAVAMYTSCFIGTALFFGRLVPYSIIGGREAAICGVYIGTQKTAAMGIPMVDMIFGHSDQVSLIMTPLVVFNVYQSILGALAGPQLLRILCK